LKSQSLRRGLDVRFLGDTIAKWMNVFETRSEQLFPHLLEYSSEQTQKYRELIRNTIETISNQLFVKRSIVVLLPVIQDEIVEGIKKDIEKEMNEIPVANLGCFPFTTLSFRQEQEGESRFQQSVLKIHEDIPKSAEMSKFLGKVRATISAYVKDTETAKRQQYEKYVQGEIEREKAAREAQFKEDIAKMVEEEAEKRRRLQAELDAEQRRRKQDQARRELERQQNQALRNETLTQQREHHQAILAIQERSKREHDELVQKMMAEKEQAEARAAAQHKEDLRLQAEREKSLQEQIAQLASQPPRVIHKGGHGFCNVC
jgi:hypothetical protein